MAETIGQDAHARVPVKGRTRIPLSVWLTSYAGLVPFAGTAFIIWFIWPGAAAQDALSALHAYGAIVLTFLGGARFGFAVRRYGLPEGEADLAALRTGIALAVLPAAAAWAALLMDAVPALTLLLAAFALHGASDWQAARTGDAPPWYAALRFPLTLLAMAALAAVLYRLTAQASGL